MEHSDLMGELEELNLAYLLLAQRLLHADRVSAIFRLKIDEEMADLLLSLSSRQLARLARTNQLLCHFGHEGAERLRQVVDNPRDQGMGGFHASLLMATRSTAALPDGKGR
ncbi:MAG: flagellar transcriptional regulator FlhD [Halomonas sp.]|uniref:flagellar transcriptional regulator FlhD n=1 Tax=Halomonas sp. TaxID=1486246 RepID=UPI0039705970